MRRSCKCDLVESLPQIQNLMQSTPTYLTSFHIQTTLHSVFIRMTLLYSVLPVQSHTPTLFFLFVFRHRPSILISSKSVFKLASAEQAKGVCLIRIYQSEQLEISSVCVPLFIHSFVNYTSGVFLDVRVPISKCWGRVCFSTSISQQDIEISPISAFWIFSTITIYGWNY